MTKLIGSLFFFICLNGATLRAQEVSALIGAQYDNASANTTSDGTVMDTPGISLGGKTGYHAGAVVFFPLKDALELRSGFIYVARGYSPSGAGLSLSDYSFSYIQIPVGLFYKFSEFGGAFLGPSADFNVSSNCPGSCSNVNSLPIGIQFGVNFHFAPQLSAELYYEAIPGKLEDHVKSDKTVDLSLLFNFE